ncbi:MAG: alkaline phosphatase D family protein [Candidatus Latescibacteria bacterium]|nr:alkaline phosphatase D family protein [Candidatus Latescibacterota bacterium]
MESHSELGVGVMYSFIKILRAILIVVVAQPLFAEQTRIAFGSCARLDLPQPIWHSVVDWKPNVFVTLGDIIYADTEDMAEMQNAYDKMNMVSGFRNLRAACPVVGIWDDHDYGENDAGASYAKREEAQQIFLDFLGEGEDTERRKTPGIYDVMYLGPDNRIQLILLDTRFFRSRWVKDRVTKMRYRPVYNSEKKMLGETQWEWLETQLEQPADFRIVASGIQIVNDEHGYECWGNFPMERDRLFKLIQKTKASGVLFISGDRHFSELSVMDGGVDYPMYDFTSSGMTHSAVDGIKAPNNKRVGKAFGELNFSTIVVDWTGADPTISLRIHDVKGTTQFEHRIQLSKLQFP